MKKLIKSYKFWSCLAGACGVLGVSLFKMFGKEINSKLVEDFIMAICGVLVVFGVVAKPKKTENKIEEITITSQENDNQTTQENISHTEK